MKFESDHRSQTEKRSNFWHIALGQEPA